MKIAVLLMCIAVVVVNCASPPMPNERPQFPPSQSQTSGFGPERGFRPERAGTEEDLNLIRRFSDDIARRISLVRSKYFRDQINRLDLYAVRDVELPGGDRSFLFKLQANNNPNDVWFVKFYRVSSSQQNSHVSGVDPQRHNLNDPLVDFPLIYNGPQPQQQQQQQPQQ